MNVFFDTKLQARLRELREYGCTCDPTFSDSSAMVGHANCWIFRRSDQTIFFRFEQENRKMC